MKSSRGFSFIELLMVVAAITILVGLAVPHLQRVKVTAQEKVALAAVRTFFEAQALHHTFFQTYGDLDSLISNQYIDDSFAGGRKSGYDFSISSASFYGFELVAVPSEIGVTGDKGFFIDETGVIRFTEDGSPPGAASPPWQ